MPYLTGDNPGSALVCRTVFIPDDPAFRAAVRGALLELAYEYNWEQEGVATPAEYAALALEMVDTFEGQECGGGGGMEFIGELGGVASAYLFDEIPPDYDNLIVKWKFRTNVANNNDSVSMIINGYGSPNYWNLRQRVLLSGVALSAAGAFGEADGNLDFAALGNTAYSNRYCYGTVNFYDCLNTSFHAWDFAFVQPRAPSDSSMSLHQGGGVVNSSQVLESIEFSPVGGTSFSSNSYVKLFGIRSE
jgi:hypothetical protein